MDKYKQKCGSGLETYVELEARPKENTYCMTHFI